MRFTKPVLAILLVIFITISMPASASADPDPRDWDTLASDSGELLDSATEAYSAILIDTNTGKVLYEKNVDTKKYPASITKIMTCLLTLENCNLTDIVPIGDLGEFEKEATKINIQKGDWMSVEDLLYGLMMASGNDAAVALAQYISGSVEAFVGLMNQKCQELGMTDTHFSNPHGLHDDNHYTTARDMAILTMEASKYPEFLNIVSTAYHTVTNTGSELGGTTEWENTNRLILPNDTYAYEFATGVKTGFTTPAQYTLVASANKNDFELIAVVLDDTQLGMWSDATTMFLYGYEYYDTINLGDLLAEAPVYEHVENAVSGNDQLELMMVADSESYYTDTKDAIAELKTNPGRFQMETNYEIPLVAPIAKDTLTGTVAFSLDGKVLMTCKLYAANDVEAIPSNTPQATDSLVTPAAAENSGPQLKQVAIYIFGILIVLFILVLMIRLISGRTKHRNYNASAKSKKHSQRYSSDTKRRRY